MAFRWYSRGAALGDRDAQNNPGTMFLEGIGCQPDKAQATYWYRKSAEQGNADAQWNLGKRYLHGDGTDQDYAEAYQWSGTGTRGERLKVPMNGAEMRRGRCKPRFRAFGRDVGQRRAVSGRFRRPAGRSESDTMQAAP